MGINVLVVARAYNTTFLDAETRRSQGERKWSSDVGLNTTETMALQVDVSTEGLFHKRLVQLGH